MIIYTDSFLIKPDGSTKYTSTKSENLLNGTLIKHIKLDNTYDCNNLADGLYYFEGGIAPLNSYGSNSVIMQITARFDLHFQFSYDWNSGAIAVRHTNFYGVWVAWTVLHSV